MRNDFIALIDGKEQISCTRICLEQNATVIYGVPAEGSHSVGYETTIAIVPLSRQVELLSIK